MCLYPKYVLNPKYKATKKNGGNIPPVNDKRVLYVPTGCNNCMECSKQKAREWQVRLLEDIKHHTNAKFITLTFSNESITDLAQELPNFKGYLLDNKIATLATRRFLERWRKEFKTSLRHWLVTELGHNGTENIHLHGIIWPTEEQFKKIRAIWKYGYVWKGKQEFLKMGKHVVLREVNYVNEKTVGYITKYVSKRDEKHQYYKPIILSSAGIGRDYVKKKYTPSNA